MLILISLAACLFTVLGGLFAIRFRDRLHLVMGFSAGAVIGVAFFDLLPEALELGGPVFGTHVITALIALGFFAYLLLDRLTTFHVHSDMMEACEHGHAHTHNPRGVMGAASLAIHSFLDGAAIGLAFQASVEIGIVVAVAVLVHDFSDGINTVSLILKNHGGKAQALKWLALDAAAPVLGVASTMFYTLPDGMLGAVLAAFCGFFMYIGASDLLPESYHRHSTFWTTVMTFLGAATLYVAIHLAHG